MILGTSNHQKGIRNVVRAAAKAAVKVAGLTGFRAKPIQSKRGPARGYTPVTVSQIHSREHAFKPVRCSSRILPAPISCVPVKPFERA
jgi:hypothetical protein